MIFIIPDHIINMARKLKRELLLLDSGDEKIRLCLKELSEVENAIKYMNKRKYSELGILDVTNTLVNIAKELPKNSFKEVMIETDCEPEIVFLINHVLRKNRNSDLTRETAILKETVEQNKNVSDSNYDEDNVLIRKFKYVKSLRAWKKQLEKKNLIDLTINEKGKSVFKYIRIAYEQKYEYERYPLAFIKRDRKLFKERLGEEVFWEIEDAFNFLYQFGKTGTYYIFIPE